MVDEQPRYKVVAQAVWIRRIVPVRLEFSRTPLKTQKPMTIRADPQTSRPVFTDRDHIGGDFWFTIPIGGKASGLPVDTNESRGGTEPENPLTIFVYRAHKRIGSVRPAGGVGKFRKRRRVCAKTNGPLAA
jgi:hypothetical protein